LHVENSLKVAPPLKFNITRQVRVFTPYIQYVKLSLKGCSIDKRTVPIPIEILNRRVSTELEKRLRATFHLIDGRSDLSDRQLQQTLNEIRKKYLKPLGECWDGKSVMLRAKRDALDKDLKKFREVVDKHLNAVAKELQGEIDKSLAQIVDACWKDVVDSPPPDLFGQIAADRPDEKQARKWLEAKLKGVFPSAEQLMSKMRLACHFSDVTYETLKEPAFKEAIRNAFPFVDWDKPFREFDAAEGEEH